MTEEKILKYNVKGKNLEKPRGGIFYNLLISFPHVYNDQLQSQQWNRYFWHLFKVLVKCYPHAVDDHMYPVLWYEFRKHHLCYGLCEQPSGIFVKLKNCGRGCCSDILLYPI